MVMDAVCLLFGIAPSWEASKKLLGDTNTLQRLMTYDKDNVDVSPFVLVFCFFVFFFFPLKCQYIQGTQAYRKK
jgi:hypothetical protein